MEKGNQSLLNSIALNYLYSESNFKDMRKLNIIGKTYGRLTVISFHGILDGRTQWNCVCECGATSVVTGRALVRGNTKSCGCLRGRIPIHGDSLYKSKPAKEYSTWSRMKQRCTDKNCTDYKNYGGRGIVVSVRWLKYVNFLADMGRAPSKDHTLERINNNKGYSPKNCRWATRSEQAKNTRRNHYITVNGVTKCVQDWCRSIGGTGSLVHGRIRLGWSIEDAVTIPAKNN